MREDKKHNELVAQWVFIKRIKDSDVTGISAEFFEHQKPPENQLKNAPKFGFSKR